MRLAQLLIVVAVGGSVALIMPAARAQGSPPLWALAFSLPIGAVAGCFAAWVYRPNLERVLTGQRSSAADERSRSDRGA